MLPPPKKETRGGAGLGGKAGSAKNVGQSFESVLGGRLKKLEKHKRHNLDFQLYLKNQDKHNPLPEKLFNRIADCGSFVSFKIWKNTGEATVHRANFCGHHLLCETCAVRRARASMARYINRYEAQIGDLKPYLVTLTVKDGEDLSERLKHLKRGVQELCKRRHRLAKTEWEKTLGGVFSYEVKRGSGSGLWHPHCHALVLVDPKNPLDARALSAEWGAFMSDSFIVDVRPISTENLGGGFAEVFKYALKISDMTHEDRFDAYQVMKSQRLIQSFGCLRGIEDVTEEDEAEDLEQSGEYEEVWCRWFKDRYLILHTIESNQAARLERYCTVQEFVDRRLQ
jgi:plasmid rolling circle replication initiator protein Rep